MTLMSLANARADQVPQGQDVPDPDTSPVSHISGESLRQLGQNIFSLFNQYKSDRRLAELRWLRNHRQYLGVYDPEMEQELSATRNRAYPRLTRVKCISVLSRIMNLMFQGNERNWELKASPWPDMTMEEMQEALEAAQKADEDKGNQPATIDVDYIMSAVQDYADQRAHQMSLLIDDQLQELGGNQNEDYVALNRKMLRSGIIFGLGVLRGPFAREAHSVIWNFDNPKMPVPKKIKIYKPFFEWLPVWDFYPDMSAKHFKQMDGYFVRQVFSRSQLRKLADRPDFLGDAIKKYLSVHSLGNYKAEWYEAELRAMGVKANVNEQKPETSKYEVLCYHGSISGEQLQLAGVMVPDDKISDDIDTEIWLIDGNVIKCAMNPWRELDVDMQMIHAFLFDEDDTSPIGFGLPTAIRDSQMGMAAATRMVMDNASVVCGPNIEVNTDLMRPDQDLREITSYKVWYREGDGPEAQWPAVRDVTINSHIPELLQVIELFQRQADAETFVGPATGGDMEKAPSEPFRTASGASMMRGDAALPFKDIIRSFDGTIQGIIQSLVTFNRTLNPDVAPMADYDVIARGATSLMAKELRGMQADNLAQSLHDEEKQEIDMRKLILARLKSRDMDDILVSVAESNRRAASASQQQQKDQETQDQVTQANIRKLLSDAFKNIAAGQKNTATADAESVSTALDLLERGINNGIIQGGGVPTDNGGQPGVSGGSDGSPLAGGPNPAQAGGPQEQPSQGPAPSLPGAPGGV